MEQKTKKIVLIGGLPNPVGGVTTFCKRLLGIYQDRMNVVIDLYKTPKKTIPSFFKGKYICWPSKFIYFYLLLVDFLYKDSLIHFNFSKTKSFNFLYFVPKFKKSNEWLLTLHSTYADKLKYNFIERSVLNKFDKITIINEHNQSYYLDYVSKDKLQFMSSYVPPICDDKNLEQDFIKQITEIYGSDKKVFICSGAPRDYYNIPWLVEYFKENKDYVLCVFYYEKGELEDYLMNINESNIFTFYNLPEECFNYALSKSFCYLRPTMKDSLGIAVCDAINFNVPVIATNVCPRYKGVYLVDPVREDFLEAIKSFCQNDVTKLLVEKNNITPFEYK